MRLLVVLLLLLTVGAACGSIAPDPPSLADEALGELYRVPSPVPPPAEGSWEWSFTDTANGFIAQDDKVASVDFTTGSVRWVRQLPSRYAVTDSSRALAAEGFLVLPRGGASAATGVRVLSLWDGGDVRWERSFAGAGQVVVVASGPEAAVVHSRCDGRGCLVTAMLLDSGRTAWTTRTAARISLWLGCQCLYAVSSSDIYEMSPLDGRVLWRSPRPPGPAPVLKRNEYRLTVITPPSPPGCRATLRGLESGQEKWKRSFAWRDAGARAKPCTFDPSRLVSLYDLMVPTTDGVTILDEYHGTARAAPLRPGAQLVLADLAWSPTAGYESWNEQPQLIGLPPPASGRPWARPAANGWLLATGPGVVLYDRRRGVRLRMDAATAVVTRGDDRLIYQVGNQLVGFGPRPAG